MRSRSEQNEMLTRFSVMIIFIYELLMMLLIIIRQMQLELVKTKFYANCPIHPHVHACNGTVHGFGMEFTSNVILSQMQVVTSEYNA